MKKLMIATVLAISSATAYAVDRIAKFDSNADGKVSFDELTVTCEVSRNLFEIADKNKNGSLSNKEMREGRSYLFSLCSK